MNENENEKNMIGDEVWELVDWDIDFETFQWLHHLCEVNNRHLEKNEKWVNWPDWPCNMLGDVDENQRGAWLSVLHSIHLNEDISVSGNEIIIIGDHGTTFSLEIMGVSIGWSTVYLPENPPNSIVKLLRSKYGRISTCEWVPGHLQSLCLEPNISGVVPTALSSMILLLNHELNIWDIATDYHWEICRWCGDHSTIPGRLIFDRTPVRSICASCRNDAPLTN